MKPELWGKQFWFTIHCIALKYPHKPNDDEKKQAINFFQSLTELLPCKKCKVHYKENLDLNELKLAVKSKESLFEYTVKLHNKVNLMNNKKELTVDEALREFEKQIKQNSKSIDLMLFFYIIVIIVIAYLVFNQYKNND